jgi:transcription initiation factor IIE alpha subunit
MSRYGMVPLEVLTHPTLSSRAVHVYALLAAYAGKKGITEVSNERLAANLGIEERSLQRFLRELTEAGFIRFAAWRPPPSGGGGNAALTVLH